MSGAAGPEEKARLDTELTAKLPPGLAAALPEVPVVTLFVAVSLARAGRRAWHLRARFGLSFAQARTIVRHATNRVR